jgi:hypothetical protein
MSKYCDMTERHVYVDGVDKGAVYKVRGRWRWQRGVGAIAVDPFAKGHTLKDVAEWARKCCNGTSAKIKRVASTVSSPEGTK